MEEEKVTGIGYKIQAEKKYRVFKKEFNGQTYYNIQMQQKNYDDTVSKYYRPVTFKKGVELDDPTGTGVDIIIHSGFENLRPNKLDKYNPITAIMITDFEICEREEETKAKAFDDFQQNLNDNEMQIDESSLPF